MNGTDAMFGSGELNPALQMRLASIERAAREQEPKRRRAIVTLIIVTLVGALLLAGAYVSMSELRSGAWEKPSTAQSVEPASVTTDSATAPAHAPVEALPVEPAPPATPAPTISP